MLNSINNIVIDIVDNYRISKSIKNKLFLKRIYTNQEISFSSNYGKTQELHEPSEGSYFWNQWFSSDFHYSEAGSLDENSKREIHSVITGLINYHNKPILFKNLAIGQRLQVIREIFPNSILYAIFTVVERLHAEKFI